MMETTMTSALFDFTADDGVQHTVWHVPDAVRFVHRFGRFRFFTSPTVITRAASAARARAELREE